MGFSPNRVNFRRNDHHFSIARLHAYAVYIEPHRKIYGIVGYSIISSGIAVAYTANINDFEFGENYREAFNGKRVLITGSGKDGGIGQALALAAAANRYSS